MISSQIFTHSWTVFACYNMDGIRNGVGLYGWDNPSVDFGL